MSDDPKLRYWQSISDLPKLVAGPEPFEPVTEPPEPIPVRVALDWTDGHSEGCDGHAVAWAGDAVLVSVDTSRGGYYTWVRADQVERRAGTFPADS